MSTIVRQLKEVPEKSYVATTAFNADVYTYTVSMSPTTYQTTGTLAANVTGATATTCPAGTVLRENGKKLYPGAHNGVTTLMVGVFWNTSKTDTTTSNMLSGFIDPNSPKFAVFSADRPNYMNVLPIDPTGGLPNQSAPTLTNGTVIASGQVRSSTVTTVTTATGTITLNPTLGQVFRLTTTLTGAVTLAATALSAAANPGAVLYVMITNGGGQTFVGDGSTVVTAPIATLTNAKSFSITLVSDGTAFREMSRLQYA